MAKKLSGAKTSAIGRAFSPLPIGHHFQLSREGCEEKHFFPSRSFRAFLQTETLAD
jgi:hypothetical protein